jgi:hypothetical protein
MKKIFVLLLFILGLLEFSLQSFASTFNGRGSISASTGGAGIATIEAGDSTILNPASVAHLKGYHFTSALDTWETSSAEDRMMQLSLTDNGLDSMFPASLFYIQGSHQARTLSPTGEVIKGEEIFTKTFQLSLANIVYHQFSVGVSVVHNLMQYPDKLYVYNDANLGFLYNPTSNMGLGLVVYNLLGTPTSWPSEWAQKRYLSLGMNYIYEQFMRVRFDVQTEEHFKTQNLTYMGGLESYLSSWFILRLGSQRSDSLRRNLISGGAGFNGPRFQINYAYQMSPQDDSLGRHTVDMIIPF